MRINTNLAALNAYRNLLNTDNRLNRSLERLSSGMRINRAADDAAGLSISEKMRGQVRGLNQSIRNAQDAISLIQTAEGALDETHSILQQMRELAVQAASDTLTASDRVEIQAEIDQLIGEVNRIAQTTEFNTKKLLDGTAAALTNRSDLDAQIFVRDGLTTVDRFGQRVNFGGTFRVTVTSGIRGDSQVQTTGIFRIRTDIIYGSTMVARAGDVAVSGTTLRQIDRFWDASGNFILESPQSIALVQGDGMRANITLYGDDTLADVTAKLNEAIFSSAGLAQNRVLSTSGVQVSLATGTVGRLYEEVSGTIVIRSAIAGRAGRITFVADEGLLNALSLSNLREATETRYTLSINMANSGVATAPAGWMSMSDIRVTGNTLIGILHQNVDIRMFHSIGFSSGTGAGRVGRMQIDGAGAITGTFQASSFFVGLTNNTMSFHIGANPLQDLAGAIGRLDAAALGVDTVQVFDRELANDAIRRIDDAVASVSAQRGRLGAIQNRLEHTIRNLGVASENLAAAESRIRDLDIALEMVDFTRNQIMLQAGMAMLAQANMRPQAVLGLLG